MNEPIPGKSRVGLAVLVGRTNVGKSTLLNALVDTKVSIVSPRPQTTRHAVHGVVNLPGGQIVFIDTPGFFRTHRSALVDRLHECTRAALEGVDAIVHVVDPTRPSGAEDETVLTALERVEQPRLLCLSKADVHRRPHRDLWLARAREANYAGFVEVSALTRRGLAELNESILRLLPEGEPLYPSGEVTNVHRDFRIAETVREQVFLQTGDEVPYRTAVTLDEVVEAASPTGAPRMRVRAAILVAEERYKGMLIGAGGSKVREMRLAARRELERWLGFRVSLALVIRVDLKLGE